MAKRLQAGFRLRDMSASALNKAMDMADRLQDFTPPPGPPAPPMPQPYPFLVVPCKNTISAALKERSIVGIKETAFTLPEIDTGEADGDLADAAVLECEAVEVELPDAEKHTAGRWGVTLGPCAAAGEDGDTGHLVIGGLIKARIDRTDGNHNAAKIKTGETDYLESAATGIPVAWHRYDDEEGEDREGMQWGQINVTGGEFVIIRGTTVGAVTPLMPAFQIEGSPLRAFTERGLAPTSPCYVAAPPGGVTLSEGATVWAIYSRNVLTFDPGDGDTRVDWLMLNFSGGSSESVPPLRWFVLINDKAPNTNTANVRFLDDNQTQIGDPLTIYDPAGNFSGRAGFRGQALHRRDLGGVEADRWEITNIESYIPLIVGKMRKTSNYPSPGDTWHADYISNATDLRDWQTKQPVTLGSEVLLQAQPPTLVNFEENQTVLLSLIHSMSLHKPTYMAVAAIGGAGAVLVRTTTSVSARSGATAGTGTIQPVTITGSALSDSGSTETAYNLATISYASGLYLTAVRINGQLVLNTWDSKSAGGWNATADQSYGHNTSGQPEWQDDADCTG